MKLTKEKLNELILDEEMATEEYRKLGLKNLSKDEARHSRYLKKLLFKKYE